MSDRASKIADARKAFAEACASDPAGVERVKARMAVIERARKRERERVEHLVLGHPRPTERVVEGKRKGRRRPKMVERPVTLSPGIDEAVTLRDGWSHKAQGTPETWERSMRTHDGALAQLHRNGTIDNDQLEWAAEIANVYRSIEADVAVKIASLETRVDQSRGGPSLVAEKLQRVRLHVAYGIWRDRLPAPKQMALDMIVGDAIGYTVAGRRYGVHWRKARALLLFAINAWPACKAQAFRMIDQEDVDRASA